MYHCDNQKYPNVILFYRKVMTQLGLYIRISPFSLSKTTKLSEKRSLDKLPPLKLKAYFILAKFNFTKADILNQVR